jgi:hypothetical protein
MVLFDANTNTKNLLRGWLHEWFRVRFHVRFAAYRRCDLLHLRFAASAICCPTRNCYRFHVACNFACNLVCNLVHAIWCMHDFCATEKRTRNRTPNRVCDLVQKKIERDSCRTPNRRCTKSHLRYAANRTWNRTQNRFCNQPRETDTNARVGERWQFKNQNAALVLLSSSTYRPTVWPFR